MRSARRLAAALLTFALVLGAALGVAQAQQVEPRGSESSRGVIIRPGAYAPGLADLRKGDTPLIAGQRVMVKQTDSEVGLLVSSAGLSDADLARTLAGAGLDAEVNHIRQILPVTPTAELFRPPLSTRPEDLPNRPDFWHVEQIGADIVHTHGITGASSTIVGVIDTGVYTDHPLLANVLLPGFDFVDSDPDAEDSVGHGTHVAGIVHSICPGCSILPVKVLDYFGGDDYTIARGIRYARQRGAKIIQISLGGPAPSTTMCQAIDAVTVQGALVVIAAGNSAGSADEWIGYPALCNPASLVVSATNRYDIPAWFSNYGPRVDIAAPGMAVWSTVPPGYNEENLIPASGTSMAAPQVSGAAALLWSDQPNLTATQVSAQLIATARDISTLPGIDDIYGPRVDVAQAFGFRSRPIVVGMSVDTPWVPRAGSAQERTVHVTTHVRGDVVTSVQLEVTTNAVTQQQPMVDQGGGIFAADYTVPENSAYQRDIFLQVVAENDAGTMYGDLETVIQEGDPIPAPTIQILNGPVLVGTPVEFLVSWDGTWNNYDFYCDAYSDPITYIPRGEIVSCTYSSSAVYYPRAMLFQQNNWKGLANLQFEVSLPPPIYLPLVVR